MKIQIILYLTVLTFTFSCSISKPPTKSLSEYDKVSNHPEYSAVKSTIEDYINGLYDVDAARIENGVDTTLRKIGYWYDKEDQQYKDNLEMSYQQLHSLSKKWNSEGNRASTDSPKKITIYEINDKTAIGKIEAVWGIDYFQLAKVDNKWKIFNIIWQSYPPKN